MKKIFSFVCALVCAISLSAQTYYIAGSSGTLFGERWNPAGMALDKQSDGTWSKTFTTCVSGKEYQFKITDGKWDNEGGTNWGFSDLASTPAGVTGNDDNNIVCTTYDANMTVIFNPSTNKITLTGVFTNGEGGEGGDPTPDPTASYYMKHSWAGGDWAWKALTANGDGTFSIRDIYGGSGCNWNTQASNDGSKWIASPTLVGEPAKGDSAIFTLTSTSGDGAITITKISSTTGGEGGEGGEGGDTPDPAATYGIGSNLNEWNPSANPMTVTDGVATCTIALGTEDFKFSVVENDTWLKNLETTITRVNNTVVLSAIDSYDNCVLTPDVAGDYVFNFTIETKTLVVVFPAQVVTGMQEVNTTKDFVKVIRDGQVLIVREGVTYNLMGQTIQ